MAYTTDSILAHLEAVEHERRTRACMPALESRVLAIKRYQQRRFAHTYADLLTTPRYSSAARFFLDELYGPGDFSQRDAQFARVVPALVRLFPNEVVETVATLAQLHALSERLDTTMGTQLRDDDLDGAAYVNAWRATGHPAEREMQIALTLSVGRALDDLTRKPLLRQTLRMMRAPARAAGLSDLQSFLESGFDTFKAMHGANDFLATMSAREQRLASVLFGNASIDTVLALGQLP